MLFKIVLLTTAAVGCGQAADYNTDSPRPNTNYATPSPSPYTPEPSYNPASAESRGYKEDDRRPYSDGPSHSRTGPPKKLVPGPGPHSYGGQGVPLSYPQRYLQPGSIIGYLAYPQPLVHGGYTPLHEPSVLPSAAFGHVALASPIALSHYRPIPLAPAQGHGYSHAGPGYSHAGPSYSPVGPTYSPTLHSSYSPGPPNSPHSSYSSGPHSSYK